MKKYTFIATSALLAMLVLSACNSTENSAPVKEEETTDSVNEQTNAENNESDREETTTVDDSTQDTTPSNDTIEYEKNGEQEEFETTMKQSPQQDYKLALSQGFSLVGEEPGRDLLMYDKDNQYSMRIEVFAKDETTYEEMAQQTENTIAITAPEGQYAPYELKTLLDSHTDILHATGYVVTYTEDDEQVVTVIFEKESKIVRLTIFDTTASEMTNTFLQMGLTIQ